MAKWILACAGITTRSVGKSDWILRFAQNDGLHRLSFRTEQGIRFKQNAYVPFCFKKKFDDVWKIEFRAVYLRSLVRSFTIFLFEFVIKKGRGFAPNEALATVQNTVQRLFENGANSRPFNHDGRDDRKNTLNLKVLKPLSAPVGKRFFRF